MIIFMFQSADFVFENMKEANDKGFSIDPIKVCFICTYGKERNFVLSEQAKRLVRLTLQPVGLM